MDWHYPAPADTRRRYCDWLLSLQTLINTCSMSSYFNVYCYTAQDITGYLQVFPGTIFRKGLLESHSNPMYVVGKPCHIYRLRGNLVIIIGFPRTLQILQGFPQRKTCRHLLMPCKHLKCSSEIILNLKIFRWAQVLALYNFWDWEKVALTEFLST